jgi:3-hydroxyisobutyrate dehydrogenase-like beta-hydroxyacid dehydrogenase
MSKRCAVIGFGEAGQSFSRTGKWSNAYAYDIKTEDGAQAAPMLQAYSDCGVIAGSSLASILPKSELVLSLVTADQAVNVANTAAAYLTPGTYYFDMNSVSPKAKQQSEKIVKAAGAHYIDAAIMAPVNPKALSVPLLLSGEQSETGAEMLSELGFSNIKTVGEEVGKASTIKMIRSVMIKGIEALTAECILAADKGDVLDEVLTCLGGDWPEKANYNFDRMMVHGQRRAAEMREVEKTLESLGIEPLLTKGTTARQQAIGELGISDVAVTLKDKLDQLSKTQKEQAA